jgi:histidinol-phosphate phosphatase family protein
LNDVRPLAQIQRWQPDFYIKGGDYSARQLRSAEAVTAYGGQVVTIPVSHHVSTSQIIERMLATERLAPPSPVVSAAEGDCFSGSRRHAAERQSVPERSAEAELLPGVGEGLAELQRAGYRLVIVTNQQGIGLGYFDVREFIAVNTALFRLLTPFGVSISRTYYCPHSAADACDCRKPGPGLLLRALREFGMRAGAVLHGRRSGCRCDGRRPRRLHFAVLVGAGGPDRPWPRFATFGEAAAWILDRPPMNADFYGAGRQPGLRELCAVMLYLNSEHEPHVVLRLFRPRDRQLFPVADVRPR